MTDAPIAAQKPKKKHRSPAYPGIDLQQAIKRTAEFYEKENRNSASFKAAVSHWSYSAKSSGALITAAALKSFGLLDEIEGGSGRTFQVSPLGLKIVADKRPESIERDVAIHQAALKPKIHAEIWRKYNGRLPSDEELQYRLENDWHFNLNAIESFIKELRATIAFAKLTESDKVVETEVEDDEENGDEQEPFVARVGDFVQWEHNGVLGLAEPKQVREITSDGKFAYVEGQHGAVPMAELIRETAPAKTPQSLNAQDGRQVQQSSSINYMLEYVVPLSSGTKAVFQWPSSLTQEDIEDLKDSLKIVERKIKRSAEAPKVPFEESAT
jgi:hypothetical protein